MKTLTLSNSEKLTLVDDLDFEFFSNFRWRLDIFQSKRVTDMLIK